MGGHQRSVRAITFDFWNTLFVPSAASFQARARRVAGLLEADEEAAAAALRRAFEHHDREWRAGRHWGVPQVVEQVAMTFGVEPSRELRQAIESPDHQAQSLPVEGVRVLLERLHAAGIRLGVVSDTGFSPGRTLRTMLDGHGLLGSFEPSALAFSDEVGVPKPDPRTFQKALAGLGVEARDAVHVGDIRRTDVAGARGVGMLAVRFNQHNDDRDGPEADLVIERLVDLTPALGVNESSVV